MGWVKPTTHTFQFSEKDGIKYFQIPKSGSTEIRMRMSRQFDIPYRGKGGNSRPGGLSYKFGPGSTPNENRVKPAVLTGEVRGLGGMASPALVRLRGFAWNVQADISVERARALRIRCRRSTGSPSRLWRSR